MGFSLLTLFKRKPIVETQSVQPAAVVQKSSADRLSKTVLPNAARSAISADAFKSAPDAMPTPMVPPPAPRPVFMTVAVPPPNPLPPAVAVALAPHVERVLPFALADVVAQMPEGFVRPLADGETNRHVLLKAGELERGMSKGRPTVSISTIYQQVPEIFVKPMAPSDDTQVPVPFAKVLEQFTKVQLRADQHLVEAVPQVETPFLQVTLEDDSKFGTSIGPIQTVPMAPVKLQPATAHAIAAAEPEATERFVPDAKSAAKIASSAAAVQAPIPVNQNGNGSAHANGANADANPSPAPTRIPFKLTTNGTGVSAAERVPASTGGTSVPISSPSPAPSAPSAGPTRIPFKLSVAPSDAPASNALNDDAPAAKSEPWLTKESFGLSETPAEEPAPVIVAAPENGAPKISLPLKPILNALPPFQLTGDVKNVPDDTRIDFPFALVQPQLVSGRVHLQPDEFAAALPEQFRGFFSSKEIAAPVSLPLQDILANLPGTALRMRDDQEEQERGSNFATPFAATAAEDAKRFKISAAPVEKPSLTSEAPAPVSEEPKAEISLTSAKAAETSAPKPEPISSEAKAEPEPLPKRKREVVEAKIEVAEAKPEAAPELPKAETKPLIVAPVKRSRAKVVQEPVRSPLQQEFDTDEPLDPKAIVAKIEKMAGVKACAIMFDDGLNLAGKLPEAFELDGFCAMAPSLMQRAEKHLLETRLGELRAMTISCTSASISFLTHETLCLAVLHLNGDLSSSVRERLNRVVQELSKTFSPTVAA